ncbi:MAG: adenylyltransferase/cytidyltransferase family protein, partial [Oscillospiraceae bacterium]|nr:adenylyltransferase/cytidyltransferase family protein [Oscillospiraceae bacterium]
MSILVLGIFDGVHLGHRAVIESAVNKGEVDVFTFSAQTMQIKKGEDLEYIYSESQRAELLRNLGARQIRSSDFGDFKNKLPEEFVKEVIAGQFQGVCVGGDFRFGKGGLADVEKLREFGKIHGFDVYILPDVFKGGYAVSSKRIRQHLKNGEIAQANELLGGNYHIKSEVMYGNRLGNTIGFPTINQYFEDYVLKPRFGVYAGKVYRN